MKQSSNAAVKAKKLKAAKKKIVTTTNRKVKKPKSKIETKNKVTDQEQTVAKSKRKSTNNITKPKAAAKEAIKKSTLVAKLKTPVKKARTIIQSKVKADNEVKTIGKSTEKKPTQKVEKTATPKKLVKRNRKPSKPALKSNAKQDAKITIPKAKKTTNNPVTKSRKASTAEKSVSKSKPKTQKKIKKIIKKPTVTKKITKPKRKTENKVKPQTKKTVTPKKQSKRIKKVVPSEKKKQTVKQDLLKNKKLKVAVKQQTGKPVEPKKQIKNKIQIKKKPGLSNKNKPRITIKSEKIGNQKTDVKKPDYKPFLKDIKQKKRRKKAQKPIEIEDKSSYLFEKTTRKKRGRRKLIKPVGSAVFRGKRMSYEFDVYNLKEKFEDFPAVFVISKRKLDKNGKGHHKIICIGQTETLGKEIVKHNRLSCIKKNKATVISILKDDSERNRLLIEENLKTSYGILCLHD
ncbi:MAG: hypothetical protein M3405_15420 [Acidobacteriota bacterium]|jgi:hypothetical protein|nr:hypothetical protein [Acidobacteriota bacterium]